jgi:sentrin-specific protease 1
MHLWDGFDVRQPKFNVNFTAEKFRCLMGTDWINDEVINFYFRMLEEKDAQKPTTLRSHFFNTFFWERMMVVDSGFKFSNVKRWTKKRDIFSADKLYFPINLGNMHWVLVVVDVQSKCVRHYDSLGADGELYLQGFLLWLQHEASSSSKVFNKEDWAVETMRPPPQDDCSSCGVCVIVTALLLSSDLPLCHGRRHFAHLRKLIARDILVGHLPGVDPLRITLIDS